MKISPLFKSFLPTAEVIASLLHPHAEVVIHDIKRNKIVAIFNNFSKRKPGDNSLLSELGNFYQEADTFGPYEKTLWNGNTLKSVSAVIRDDSGKPVGLLCINLDLAKFEECQKFLSSFISKSNLVTQPEILFRDDWQEKIHEYIKKYLQEKHLTIPALTQPQRMDLIQVLYKEGAFKGKNAANYVANILGISRASVYNYVNGAAKSIQ
jgi:predicted transcriptional regulator YheO